MKGTFPKKKKKFSYKVRWYPYTSNIKAYNKEDALRRVKILFPFNTVKLEYGKIAVR